jgi:uncharacterized protein YbcC (UPF0753/DUF2309 family)
MVQRYPYTTPAFRTLEDSLECAIRAIPPLWPLSSSVAVNPFLGQSQETLAQTAARLTRITEISVTMPRAWYREKIAAGAITKADLIAAWSDAPDMLRPATVSDLQRAITAEITSPSPLPTVAELAQTPSGKNWPALFQERFGAWAGSYFDQGQAHWPAPREQGAYPCWRAFSIHDLTPEISGLADFARHVADAPESAIAAISRAVETLGLRANGMETYFHQLLLTMGGWAQLARYEHWQAELSGRSNRTLVDFLAIALLWEEALFLRYRAQIGLAWSNTCWHQAQTISATAEIIIDSILQEALERAAQRELAQTLAHSAQDPNLPALFQAAFCIDVRSEVYRHALESLAPNVQTKGFAGFFGLPVMHYPLGSTIPESRLPVLLNPRLSSCSGAELPQFSIKARAVRAWGRFKMAAVSSFAFVEGAGHLYIAMLLRDGLGLSGRSRGLEPAPCFRPDVDVPARVEMAASVLRAMSFTSQFAPLILLLGHGASAVNNPHTNALHCGACGGHPGDVNSRLLAGILNDLDVRKGLRERGIDIPPDTLFLAGLHDTTTDHVTLFPDGAPNSHASQIAAIQTLLDSAGAIARRKRSLNIPGSGTERGMLKRSRDWSQTRPEWGLAGCQAFVAAPRSRTRGRDLHGRVFLHDYDWRQDQGFKVLELIMTAPVVVASWISLQYYGSVVAPRVFGAGNKLLHNVTGGIGIVEGNGGNLRGGLPWQSVHDGARLMHEPLRLTVCVEAPRDALTEILSRHGNLRELFDNRWLHLFALDDRGQMAWRYRGGLKWEAFNEAALNPKAA